MSNTKERIEISKNDVKSVVDQALDPVNQSITLLNEKIEARSEKDTLFADLVKNVCDTNSSILKDVNGKIEAINNNNNKNISEIISKIDIKFKEIPTNAEINNLIHLALKDWSKDYLPTIINSSLYEYDKEKDSKNDSKNKTIISGLALAVASVGGLIVIINFVRSFL